MNASSASQLGWYARRVSRMSPAEVAWRARDRVLQAEWRSYFRSTIAHNTAEVDGRSQSSEGGPFMWVRHAHAREVEVIDDGALHRGETDPILGWYSGGLGQRIPACTLIGCGRSAPGVPLITRLEFADIQALPFGYGRGRCVTAFGWEKGGDAYRR
jgi:Heparinase II/III-like protein